MLGSGFLKTFYSFIYMLGVANGTSETRTETGNLKSEPRDKKV